MRCWYEMGCWSKMRRKDMRRQSVRWQSGRKVYRWKWVTINAQEFVGLGRSRAE
jgi:hypothetical protein